MRSIIEFWRAVEMFSPQVVPPADPKKRVFDLADGGPMPWDAGHPVQRIGLTKDQAWRHTVYVGLYPREAMGPPGGGGGRCSSRRASGRRRSATIALAPPRRSTATQSRHRDCRARSGIGRDRSRSRADSKWRSGWRPKPAPHSAPSSPRSERAARRLRGTASSLALECRTTSGGRTGRDESDRHRGPTLRGIRPEPSSFLAALDLRKRRGQSRPEAALRGRRSRGVEAASVFRRAGRSLAA
jgi:hypothetical protein